MIANGKAGSVPKIEIRGLTKAFGRKQVLRGIDLDVSPRESLVVIGGSGTGKSVLIKCVLGLIEPDSGSIKVDGEETVGLHGEERERVMRKFGMLFQGAALFDSLPVWENVAFGLMSADGVGRHEAKEAALRNLAAVGLGPEVGELYPAELSGGMQKRVALARAIARKPEIIFFDEPTTGLDPIMADVINDLIIKCVGSLGATALSITHDMASVRRIAHRVAMIHEGRIIWQGPVGEIDSTGNAYVEQFIHGRAEGPIKMPVRPL
ncbi:MAG TPA: ATP-binding cassette domain-containing protein [Hypericibacter adhaerens]|jgi:phospholipid/cholesterol/gamma-HCH transport system ATP-binding protein|uniref:ABC transporter ATP-binding protein n=1 Tax=Hypericibacter adhaerens TaxID=2602016 RepID=A0A5J6N7R5_9PROT|nr:ATP-binding cassette domain-containing protein [Hypericibacter adhaerens]QEX23166.1 ABC transporter ATP-binding protein [Hypericibacter adhaerens]HWA43869.1 ATP-binding cassette domain-containing protein [Hypericibacter adhaerens]